MRALLILFLVGCSSNPSNPDGGVDAGSDVATDGPQQGPTTDYTSGSRLRAEVYTSADGAKKWHGWFDQTLGVDCQFEWASDGALRCLPYDAHLDAAFGNSGCTERVAPADTCKTGDPKFIIDESTPCASDVYAVGAKLGPLTTLWSNPNCTSSPYTGTENWFDVGAKQDLSTFVKGTVSREARGSALSMQFIVGDDGSREPQLPYDTARKGTCDAMPSAYTPSADRCVPQRVAFFEFQYSDTGCGNKAAVRPALGCNPPSDEVLSAAFIYEIVKCQGATLPGVANIGAKSTGPLYQNPASCGVDTNAPAEWYPVTTPIDATSLPALALAQTGTGRIIDDWRVSGTQQLYVAGFFDTQQKVACLPRKGSDDVLRCIPDIPSMAPLYSDDKCTTAVLEWSQQVSCPPTTPASVFLLERWNGCETEYGHATLGAKIATPAALYQWDGNTKSCTSLGTVDGTADYYALTVTDPTTFGQLTDVKE